MMFFYKFYTRTINRNFGSFANPLIPSSRDGFAIISVLVIMALLGVIAVPLLNTINKSRESAISIRVASHLSHEARENFEIGVHLTKLDGGIPSFFKTGISTSILPMGTACIERINAADNEYLGQLTIGNPNLKHSLVSTSNNRKVATIALNNGRQTGTAFEEIVIISCAMAETGEMGVYAGKLAVIDGAFHPINFGQF